MCVALTSKPLTLGPWIRRGNRFSVTTIYSGLLAAFALALVLMSSVCDALAASGRFYVPINRSELITVSSRLGEVIVANPEVADIYVHGKDKVSVIGKSLGSTTVRLFDEDNKMVKEVDVYVTYDLPAIRKALHEFLPYERVGVEMVNTRVALTGEVSSAAAVESAIEIAEQFIYPNETPKEMVAALNEKGADGGSVSPIINLMKISAGQQVMLRIRVGEIQRGTLKQLGMGFNAVKASGEVPFNILSSNGALGAAASVVGALTGVDGVSAPTRTENSLSAAIDALERDNLLKILAEPNLVALSGEQAEFLAGGEVPIPIAQQNNTISVEYKPFGVSVRFTPYVLSENRIRIQVQPEVSERNDGDGVDISGNGTIVPAFDVRRASTTVELAPGESFMIAGLMQDTVRSDINQVPGVSEVPVLSSLFRKTGYDRQETELVLAVTPYLVDPLKSADVRLPSDDFRPASFMESVFYGAMGSLSGNAIRISQTPSLEGPVGFMMD